MAKVAGAFESIVGSYWDETVKPNLVATDTPEDALGFLRGEYVQSIARDKNAKKLISEIEDFFGVTII